MENTLALAVFKQASMKRIDADRSPLAATVDPSTVVAGIAWRSRSKACSESYARELPQRISTNGDSV